MKIKTLLPYKIISAAAALVFSIILVLYALKMHLTYNFSPSVPCGFYLVIASDKDDIKTGDYVEFIPPDAFRPYLYGRGWLDDNMTITKQVGGLEGTTFCVKEGSFTVKGKYVGKVFVKDRLGLPLPVISGCRKVGAGEFLPVGNHHERSFDGRYMGAVPRKLIIGKAIPLWTM